MSKTDYYSEAAHGPHEIFELGNYQLESGITLPNARIAYKTLGTLNAAKDNVVLFPHMWSGTPKAMEIDSIEHKVTRDVRDLSDTELLAISGGNGIAAAETGENERGAVH